MKKESFWTWKEKKYIKLVVLRGLTTSESRPTRKNLVQMIKDLIEEASEVHLESKPGIQTSEFVVDKYVRFRKNWYDLALNERLISLKRIQDTGIMNRQSKTCGAVEKTNVVSKQDLRARTHTHLSLSLARAHSHTHAHLFLSLSLSLTHARTHTHALVFLAHAHLFSCSRTHTHDFKHTRTHTYTFFYAHESLHTTLFPSTHTRTHLFSLAHAHSHTHTHFLSRAHTHTPPFSRARAHREHTTPSSFFCARTLTHKTIFFFSREHFFWVFFLLLLFSETELSTSPRLTCTQP